MNFKAKILTIAGTIMTAVATVKASAYVPTYSEADFVPILFDAMGTAGAYIVSKIGTIGSLLLVIFALGAVYTIVQKGKTILHL